MHDNLQLLTFMKSELSKILFCRRSLIMFLTGLATCLMTNASSPAPVMGQDSIPTPSVDSIPQKSDYIKKILFLGDSMTGWMAERFNSYGEINDFEVATVVWDGSTIKKWGNSPQLREIIDQLNPDAIFLSLGMNELFEENPRQNLEGAVENLKNIIGDIPFLWIGPPSWPGHSEGKRLNDWLENELGKKNFFRSSDLVIPRQSKSNPHPDKNGIEVWIDEVAKWIPENTDLKFNSLDPPEKGAMSRGSTFIYKRMKESL